MIRFLLVYALCGIGCDASLTVNRPDMSFKDRALVSIAWPAFVTGIIVSSHYKERN